MNDPSEKPKRGAREASALLHREGSLWVFFKPSGLACHPGDPRVPDLVTYARTTFGAPPTLSPVHRLDRETSGVLLMSTDADERGALGKAFAEHRVEKTYLALVQGTMHRKGIIREPLDDQRRGRPLPAITRYRSLERLGGFTLIAVRPQTGRKHQIRRHLQHLGRPIVGDTRYPGRRRMRVPAFPGRLWLHALRVVLPDGRTFEAPLPEQLSAHLLALGSRRRLDLNESQTSDSAPEDSGQPSSSSTSSRSSGDSGQRS